MAKAEIRIEWSEEKNELLKKARGVSFEKVATIIESGTILDDIKHPNQKKYPNQKMYILEIDQHVFIVPFVEDDEKIFLKTIIPGRKYTKMYLQ